MKGEIDRLKDFIHKNNPDAEIFIHPEPQEDKLKQDGWERVPFTWRGNKIWIKRKPAPDQKHLASLGLWAMGWFPEWSTMEWVVYITLGVVAYVVVVVGGWWLFLTLGDNRSSYQKWLDRKEEDADQIEQLKEWENNRKGSKHGDRDAGTD